MNPDPTPSRYSTDLSPYDLFNLPGKQNINNINFFVIRNFGHHWNDGGSSNDKCFDTYHGPEAFSEPETSAVRDYILYR